MLTRFLTKIPSLGVLLGSKWFLAGLAALIAGAAIWLFMSGQNKGIIDGYERAESTYRDMVVEAIEDTVSRRDTQWESRLEKLREVLAQNQRTDQQDRELADTINRIEDRLNETLQNAGNLGECNLTPEFDRLLGAEPQTDPPS